jgi:hypothetical protein
MITEIETKKTIPIIKLITKDFVESLVSLDFNSEKKDKKDKSTFLELNQITNKNKSKKINTNQKN